MFSEALWRDIKEVRSGLNTRPKTECKQMACMNQNPEVV
jgi:hypothetical protein